MYFNFTFTLFTVEQGKGCPELWNNRLEENRRIVQLYSKRQRSN